MLVNKICKKGKAKLAVLVILFQNKTACEYWFPYH